MIAPTYISSSNIDACGYQRGKLFLRFKSGGAYSYDNVPFDYFDTLTQIESAGKFFARFIRGKFRHHKLENDPFGA